MQDKFYYNSFFFFIKKDIFSLFEILQADVYPLFRICYLIIFYINVFFKLFLHLV